MGVVAIVAGLDVIAGLFSVPRPIFANCKRTNFLNLTATQ